MTFNLYNIIFFCNYKYVLNSYLYLRRANNMSLRDTSAHNVRCFVTNYVANYINVCQAWVMHYFEVCILNNSIKK